MIELIGEKQVKEKFDIRIEEGLLTVTQDTFVPQPRAKPPTKPNKPKPKKIAMKPKDSPKEVYRRARVTEFDVTEIPASAWNTEEAIPIGTGTTVVGEPIGEITLTIEDGRSIITIDNKVIGLEGFRNETPDDSDYYYGSFEREGKFYYLLQAKKRNPGKYMILFNFEGRIKGTFKRIPHKVFNESSRPKNGFDLCFDLTICEGEIGREIPDRKVLAWIYDEEFTVLYKHGVNIFFKYTNQELTAHVLKGGDRVIFTLTNGKKVNGKAYRHSPVGDYVIGDNRFDMRKLSSLLFYVSTVMANV